MRSVRAWSFARPQTVQHTYGSGYRPEGTRQQKSPGVARASNSADLRKSELHAESGAQRMGAEVGIHVVLATETESLVLVVGVAVFDARRDVVRHHRLGAGAQGPAP